MRHKLLLSIVVAFLLGCSASTPPAGGVEVTASSVTTEPAHSDPAPQQPGGDADADLQKEVEALRKEVKALRAEVADLKSQLAAKSPVAVVKEPNPPVAQKLANRVEKAGGDGGDTEFAVYCMDGMEPVGIWGASGRVIDSVGLVCRNTKGELDRTDMAGGNGGSPFEFTCAEGARLVGLSGNAGAVIDRVAGLCAKGDVDTTTGAAGGKGGKAFSLSCPEGKTFLGVSGRYGSVVDSLTVVCD